MTLVPSYDKLCYFIFKIGGTFPPGECWVNGYYRKTRKQKRKRWNETILLWR